MSVRKFVKGLGVTVLIGVPLIFAATIFLATLAFLIMIWTIGWPMGI
ncbi:MAG: hypothetical protein Q8L22_27910 [Reyranella sp.]|nr:hypothetical protein [Reyranella sp.]